MGLQTDVLPRFCHNGTKSFLLGEKHVDRICAEDVLILMTAGTLYFEEDGTEQKCSAGEYYIQRRGLRQRGVIPSETARYYYIHFIGAYGEGGIPIRGKYRINEMRQLWERLEETEQDPGSAILEKNAVFLSILVQLLPREPSTPGRRAIEEVTALARQDLSRPLSLGEMASHCGYSSNRLIQLFRKEVGVSPCAYMTEWRLNTAKVLMENSSRSLSDIAVECGFGNYVNFYKAFVKHNGCTPGEWRQRIWGNQKTDDHFPRSI